MKKFIILFLILSFISCNNKIYYEEMELVKGNNYLVYSGSYLYKEKIISSKHERIEVATVVTLLDTVKNEENVYRWSFIEDENGKQGWVKTYILKEYSEELYEELLAEREREREREWIEANTKTPAEIRDEMMDELVYDGLLFPVGETVEEIKQNLGEPDNEIIEEVPNRYNESFIDKKIELEWDGLYLKLYYASSKDSLLKWKTVITSNKYKIYKGLDIGSGKDFVIETLGQPDRDEGNTIGYYNAEFTDLIIFVIENNVVVEVRWEYYLE